MPRKYQEVHEMTMRDTLRKLVRKAAEKDASEEAKKPITESTTGNVTKWTRDGDVIAKHTVYNKSTQSLLRVDLVPSREREATSNGKPISLTKYGQDPKPNKSKQKINEIKNHIDEGGEITINTTAA